MVIPYSQQVARGRDSLNGSRRERRLQIRWLRFTPGVPAIFGIRKILAAKRGADEHQNVAVLQLDNTRFLKPGAIRPAVLEPSRASSPGFAGVVGKICHRDPLRANFAVYRWMQSNGHHQSARAKLYHAIVIENVVAFITNAADRLAPGLSFVRRVAQIRMAIRD